jgi:hypothetical protein
VSEVKKEYKVVIDRSKWRTGQDSEQATGKGDTFLRNVQGYSCCLGFICKAIKPEITEASLNVEYPSLLREVIPLLSKKEGLGTYSWITDTALVGLAVEINDDEDTTVTEKEAALLALFADTPIELEFVGSPTPFANEEEIEL